MNALDGVLLIVSHGLKDSYPELYKTMYRHEYIYSVWIVEVRKISLIISFACLC